MKAYIGVAKCCGNITAAMIDDENTSAKDVADFARSMHKTDRELRHVDGEPMTINLQRCACGKTRSLALS
jgi:hypothetical protein